MQDTTNKPSTWPRGHFCVLFVKSLQVYKFMCCVVFFIFFCTSVMASYGMTFVVIEFPEEGNAVAAVPKCWIEKKNNQLYSRWPDHLQKRNKKHLINAIMSSQPATEEYKLYKIEIIKQFSNYEEAKKFESKLIKGYGSKELSDGSLGIGKRKKKQRKLSSDEENTNLSYSFSDGDSSKSLSLLSVENLVTNKKTFGNTRKLVPRISTPINNEVPDLDITPNTLISPISRDQSPQSSEYGQISQQIVPELQQPPAEFQPQQNVKLPLHTNENNINEAVPSITNNDVMKMLTQVLQEVRDLKKILISNGQRQQIQVECPNLPVEIPLKNYDEFEQFEEFLQDRPNFKLLVSYLQNYLSNEPKQYVLNVMNELITDQLASQFNYIGKKPKRKFKDTNTEKLIYCTVRVSGINITRDDFKNFIQHHLKYAPQRRRIFGKKREDEHFVLNRLL